MRAYTQALDFCINILCSKMWRELTGDKPEKEQVDMMEKALREIERRDLNHLIGR